ncbi:hypothetical protein JOM56_015030 [Amanita muscaria]
MFYNSIWRSRFCLILIAPIWACNPIESAVSSCTSNCICQNRFSVPDGPYRSIPRAGRGDKFRDDINASQQALGLFLYMLLSMPPRPDKRNDGGV